MLVHIGSDHAGLELKAHLIGHLRGLGHSTLDHGAFQYRPDDDYPPFILQTAIAVAARPGSLGIVIGGSGNGEAIAANKVPGIRAALAWNVETARLGREHNDANILSLGARMHTLDFAAELATVFVSTPFSEECRHIHRIAMIRAFERSGEVPVTADAPVAI
ncbi:ribose-5-phosphate isomerase [Streptacidiphilus carbonis]|jgi:ribose 5-phosphate isomerase B|uniref:ribose-5-phosphate isomerase n=1 Tax=Streptacidiphilus carbonis TaxID=105422 RepID=UPI0005AA5445|nr:ribose-5-phosphate isomerase [Streptacidiphilus carbonis]